MIRIEGIPALKDNYIWVIARGDSCVVVDPADAVPILSWLRQNALRLSAILITHGNPPVN